MVDKLRLSRISTKSSLIQTTFVMQKPPNDSSMLDLFLSTDPHKIDPKAVQDWGELKLSPYMLPQQEGQFDLSLEMADNGTNLEGFLKFDANLFSEKRIHEIRNRKVKEPQVKHALSPKRRRERGSQQL